MKRRPAPAAHWPKVTNRGLTCTCGDFVITGVIWREAQRRWWEHADDARGSNG